MCAKLDATGLLADLTFAISRGKADAGREYCRLYRRADGGYWMVADLELSGPSPRTQYVEIRAGADWGIESLTVRLSGNVQRDASHHAEGPVWRATIQTDEATIERAVHFGPEVLVDFDSVWLKTIALNRPRLAPGQARQVDVIQVELPSLEPQPAQLQYECVGPEHITTPAGDFDTLHYIVSGAHHLWADSRGMIIVTRRTIEGLTHSRRLLEYHWLGNV